jgi:Rab11 family-interacting protein 3/4
MRHAYNSELLDVYCSQCCKKINLLNDLEARLKNLKANRWGHSQRGRARRDP